APDSLARPPNWRAARHLETALPAVVAARSRGRPRHLRDARSGRPGAELPPDCHRAGEKTRLHSEPEVDDVTVLDDVVLALEPQLPRLAAPRLAPEAHELVVGDHLGADEAALDVAVDLARRLEGRRAAADRPGAALVLAGGEEAHQVEERVAGADEAGARALGEAQIGEERVPVGGLELGDLGREAGGARPRPGAPGLRAGGAPARG